MLGAANVASLSLMAAADSQQARTIQTETVAQTLKQQADRWKILREVQTKIFEIQQEVTINQAKTADKLHSKWSDYIRQ